jgi:16S rRNA (cytidine1402-2'-O)-methyltransferase
MSGIVYIVGTPIGNLEDLSLRAKRVLAEVDTIYAEDTRVSTKLLQRYQIQTKLRSFREAAETYQIQKTLKEIIGLLENGKDIAYISDAGTPGVSDPGNYLVESVLEAGYQVVPIPGSSALASILSIAGMSVQKVLFVGFLPRKKGHQTALRRLNQGLGDAYFEAIIFYESPERILNLIAELRQWQMPLKIILAREMTKLHEEVIRGSLEEVEKILKTKGSIKGEITLLVGKET